MNQDRGESGGRIALGAGFGLVFGAAFGHLVLGLMTGAAIGVVVGSIRARRPSPAGRSLDRERHHSAGGQRLSRTRFPVSFNC